MFKLIFSINNMHFSYQLYTKSFCTEIRLHVHIYNFYGPYSPLCLFFLLYFAQYCVLWRRHLEEFQLWFAASAHFVLSCSSWSRRGRLVELHWLYEWPNYIVLLVAMERFFDWQCYSAFNWKNWLIEEPCYDMINTTKENIRSPNTAIKKIIRVLDNEW